MIKTAREFNEKYKDYLGERHYGLAIDDEVVVNYCDKRFQDFVKVPGFKYYQIKRKFNYVCFYCDGLDNETIKEFESHIKGWLDFFKHTNK